MNKENFEQIAKKVILNPWYRWKQRRPSVGSINFGDLRSVKPISECYGEDRGLPIDRYYIENFLASHAEDIRGNVMEIGDSYYTDKFGGDRVQHKDVFHAVEGNPIATIVGDLTQADHISDNTFDCLILTETLQLIYEIRQALQTTYRILKPGGVVLATVPGISQISDIDWGDSWYWNYTSLSMERLFAEVFSRENLQVKAYGNVLSATSFLQGLAMQELNQEELDYLDPNYELKITIRAQKEL